MSLFSEDLQGVAPRTAGATGSAPPLPSAAARAARPTLSVTEISERSAPVLEDTNDDGPTVSSSSLRDRLLAGAITRAPLTPGDASGAAVDVIRQGAITVVSVRGRLSESFRGDAVGEKLSGTVVFDLAEVERITSFGVREWLAMLDAAKSASHIYLARCSEAVVAQLGMIRKFAGTAKIVSFFAPYLCESCGQPFERLFRVEHDPRTFSDAMAPKTACPFCAGPGRFDDDPETYLGFARAHAQESVPEAVSALHDTLVARAPAERREIVDKLIEGDVTRVRVHTKLTSELRWSRIFDGLEGLVVLDLGSSKGVDSAGSQALVAALGSLDGEVEQLTLERCPEAIAVALASAGLPARVKLGSLTVEGHCASCAARRSALLLVEPHRETLAAGRAPSLTCKRCSGALEYVPSAALLPLFRSRVRDRESAVPAVVSDPVRPRRPVTSYALGGAVAVLAVALGASVLGNHRTEASAGPALAAAPPVVASAPPVPAKVDALPPGVEAFEELAPAWTERSVALESDRVLVVGHGPRAVDLPTSLDGARKDAVVRLVEAMKAELAPSPMSEMLESRTVRDPARGAEAVVQRYVRQVGNTALPERVRAASRKVGNELDTYAQYTLSRKSFDDAVSAYKKATPVGSTGLTVSRFFPLLEQGSHSDGELVVVAMQRVRPGELSQVRVGDVLRSVGGRIVLTPEGAAKTFEETWAASAPSSALRVEIESNGMQRSLSMYKPR